jgi:hypothetical protein
MRGVKQAVCGLAAVVVRPATGLEPVTFGSEVVRQCRLKQLGSEELGRSRYAAVLPVVLCYLPPVGTSWLLSHRVAPKSDINRPWAVALLLQSGVDLALLNATGQTVKITGAWT